MELLMFWTTAAIALIGAVGMLLDRNAVHSALFLLLNFAAIAVLFLLLQSPFLAAIQVIVYAGAIMVLFVFVVMLLGAERVEDRPDKLAWQRMVALLLGVVLLVEAFIVGGQANSVPATDEVATQAVLNEPAQIAEALFTTYLLPFEITGVLLLVAIVGVAVLQLRARTHGKQQAAAETQAE